MNLRSSAATVAAPAAALLLAAATRMTLTGCAPAVVAAGVGAGVMVATDRRTTAAQADDESIERRIADDADMTSRAHDTYLTGAVKSRLAESSAALAKHVKVVTERSVVYLMGLVTAEEGAMAARIASSTSGVARVVKVFEYTG